MAMRYCDRVHLQTKRLSPRLPKKPWAKPAMYEGLCHDSYSWDILSPAHIWWTNPVAGAMNVVSRICMKGKGDDKKGEGKETSQLIGVFHQDVCRSLDLIRSCSILRSVLLLGMPGRRNADKDLVYILTAEHVGCTSTRR
jgi:hypothetical protein